MPAASRTATSSKASKSNANHSDAYCRKAPDGVPPRVLTSELLQQRPCYTTRIADVQGEHIIKRHILQVSEPGLQLVQSAS